MKRFVLFGSLMVLVLLTFGCQKETTPQVAAMGTVTSVDARYVSELPLVNLDVAVFDTEQNPLNGTIGIKGYNELFTLGKINVSEGSGNYRGRMVKSNKPYEYFFSSEGYYNKNHIEVAKIPIRSVDENVSLNWSFVFSPIHKKGSIDLSIYDYYTEQPLDSDKPVKINISNQRFNHNFRLKIEMTPFIFNPYLVLTDGSPWDKYDFYHSSIDNGVFCSDNPDFSITDYRQKDVPSITSRQKISCEVLITFTDTYRLDGMDFVFFVATKDETGSYFGFENVSNVIKFEVVT